MDGACAGSSGCRVPTGRECPDSRTRCDSARTGPRCGDLGVMRRSAVEMPKSCVEILLISSEHMSRWIVYRFMALVSDYYHLGTTQAGLDFVDVELDGDTKVFIDPFVLRNQRGVWARKCVALLQSYFSELLIALAEGNQPKMLNLLKPTDESNETRLGMSKGKPDGRGVGAGKKAAAFVEVLTQSRAAKSGLLSDLEDTGFFVEGIAKDGISDMATAILRFPLIAYTRHMCAIYNIPTEEVASRAWWDADELRWIDGQVELPVPDKKPLLLVPKSIVRLYPSLDTGKYYRNHLRTQLFEAEASNPASGLLGAVRGDRAVVSMEDFSAKQIDEYFGTGKQDIARHTARFPDAYKQYKEDRAKDPLPPLTEEDLASNGVGQGRKVDYYELLEAIQAIAPGKPGAHLYHQAVSTLLNAVFEGALGNLEYEFGVNEGRKRIDFTLDNMATSGFFRWLSLNNYHSAIIPFECKNYTNDPKNPEFDQLRGRLGADRGDVGILVCRTLADKEMALRRCKDVRNDKKGYLLILDDSDLKTLVDDVVASSEVDAEFGRHDYPVLMRQFKTLIS